MSRHMENLHHANIATLFLHLLEVNARDVQIQRNVMDLPLRVSSANKNVPLTDTTKIRK